MNMYKAGWMAATAASILFTQSSMAADLAGLCCEDVEERVAELEASTVRKGNRNVSLTISGYIAQEITFWDDGAEFNAYIHGFGPTQTSNVVLSGKAVIVTGWTAGYMIRIQDLTGNPVGMSQAVDTNNSKLNTQVSMWYLDSKDYGKIAVGRMVHAAKSVCMHTDLSGTGVVDNFTLYDGFPGFNLRTTDGILSPLTWGQLGFCYTESMPIGGDCSGIVMNGVRYDAPVFGGLSASASWGEDDFWEMALRYAGEMAGFKVTFGVGYTEMGDENTSAMVASILHKDSKYFQVGGYAEHIATGLFLHGVYGNENNSGVVISGGLDAPNSEHYYVKGGIRRKWLPLGATVIYADYAIYVDQVGPAAVAAGVTSSEFEQIGGGLAQEIDAAAMTIYTKYKRYHADVDGIDTEFRDADFISAGALIRF